ncbi:hypothetical protein [Acinetobacter defluvii]|uniref:hypothetical protein n=1 Tax=Acinetobacter defluvii TaxID=1871111 RepID=UPI0014902B01|nr:hypothetical protein [Acinetobacter defluvii]
MNKIELEIQRLSNMIQFGVGQQSLGLDLDLLTDKMTGYIPRGADAPNFATRKNMISAQIFMKCIQFFFTALIAILLALVFIWLSWGQLQKQIFEPLFLGVALLSILITIFCLFKFKHYFQIFNAIRQVTQIQADPERRSSHVDENTLAQQFAPERRKTRFIGIFISLLSGGLLAYILIAPPQNLIKLAFVLPFMLMFGLGIIIHPISKAESLYLYGSTQLSWKYFPTALKICTVLGVVLCLFMLAWFEI